MAKFPKSTQGSIRIGNGQKPPEHFRAFSSSYFDRRAAHDKYAQSEGRSFHKKRKKDLRSSESAGIPEYVSMRQRRYGESQGRRR